MKFTPDLVTFIEKVIKTGKLANIESAIIDATSGTVRGIDEDRTVVLFHNENVPEFPVGLVGINRVGLFLSRVDIVKNRDGFDVDAEIVTNDGVEYVKALHMKSADTKVDFRCANPDTIKAPKQINDTIIYSVQLNAEAVSILQKGAAAMGAESVSIIGGEDGVSFELEDVSKDIFRHVFASDSIRLADGDGVFSHKYPTKTLLALFGQNPTGVFEIGEKGILRIAVNDLNLYVLPQV